MNNKFLMIISKGRILNDVLFFLKKIRHHLKFYKFSRKLYFKIKKKNIYIIIVKNIDIKKHIKLNISDIYLIGKDLFYEKINNYFYKYYNVNISKSKLCLIKNKNKNNINIYTKYKNISKNYLNYKNLKLNLKFINSSIENILNLNISNFIIDIISSYKTLKINKLFEIENLINFNLIILLNRNLIYKKIYYKFFYKFIK